MQYFPRNLSRVYFAARDYLLAWLSSWISISKSNINISRAMFPYQCHWIRKLANKSSLQCNRCISYLCPAAVEMQSGCSIFSFKSPNYLITGCVARNFMHNSSRAILVTIILIDNRPFCSYVNTVLLHMSQRNAI